MKKYVIVVVIAYILNANPLINQIINEFQVAPSGFEQIEFYFLSTPSFNNTIHLLNTSVTTPAGTSFVDDISLVAHEYLIIDESVLNGPFSLPDDSGYIFVDNSYWSIADSIVYPLQISAPPPHYTAAKFHCYYYFWMYPEQIYGYMIDWYIDPTPTLGQENDDYPGCIVSGHVYNNDGLPLANARITATAQETWEWGEILNPPQYPQCCTTYTSVDGSYMLNFLLPWKYYVEAYADDYFPETELTPHLTCSNPVTNLDFYLQSGIFEHHDGDIKKPLHVYPNPFYSDFDIVLSTPHPYINIYDASGKLCMKIDNRTLSSHIHVDGGRLSQGIYFLSIPAQKSKIIKF